MTFQALDLRLFDYGCLNHINLNSKINNFLMYVSLHFLTNAALRFLYKLRPFYVQVLLRS